MRSSVEPLFPGYFFSRLDPELSEVRLVNRTPGVIQVLGYDNEPWSVPDDLIKTIRDRLDRRKEQAFGRFECGDRVKILSGPFSGIDAVFDSHLSGSGRARVLIQVVSHVYRAEIHAKHLQRI